ncbi:iron-sulfur cluster repair protein YtfE (RIC family) [Kibdelosporangium banguiense]|uniref:Iron-sulfur cluster repair protein YtfE (RIC family) n=1 Tax=Kibdelosporangium banguiense TaxID=1365924 RepID=A0ABS4TN30_9PSEU|nr:hemerythrin domain-containing protein [Kibdelosporangium banguiense]MBP2325769.1 iron-sulfur cluster repair protein YtfE (RIC family) [Kibdelosporangium banguiense]
MTTDLSSVLAAAHQDLAGLLHEVETSPASPEHRRQLADHMITELVAHAVAEEQHLYPAVREYLPDGERIVKARLTEHAETEQTMTELQNMSPADAQFELLLSKLTTETRRHIEDTETVLLPGLQKACPAADRREIGAKLLHTKQIAPGRPHPAAADRKSGDLILDPGVCLVEKVRNALA